MSRTNWGKLSKALKSHFIDLHNWSLNINFGELALVCSMMLLPWFLQRQVELPIV